MGFKLRFIQHPASWGDLAKDPMHIYPNGTLRIDKLVGGGKYVADVLNLVYQITQECAERKDIIDELRISGHGSNKHFRIGIDIISLDTLSEFVDLLKRIVPLLNPRGVVILEHCHPGENLPLMAAFSAILGGIRVRGREGNQDSLTGPSGKEWEVQGIDDQRNPNQA